MVLNDMLGPLTTWMGLCAHVTALLGAQQMNLSLLAPALAYYIVMWSLWISSFLGSSVRPNTVGLVLYPLLIFAQGKLIYDLLLQQRAGEKETEAPEEGQYVLLVEDEESTSETAAGMEYGLLLT